MNRVQKMSPTVDGATADTRPQYTPVAVTLHWAMASLILLNLIIGPFMEGLAPPGRFVVIVFHISCGITVLALTLVRIVWRLMHRPPPLLTTGRLESWGAKSVHVLLYALMLFMPLTGWAVISANPPPGVVPGAPPNRGRPPAIWGLIELPLIAPIQRIGATIQGVPRQKVVHDRLVGAHAVGGFIMMFLVALHILGALKHEFFDGGGELRRMAFARRGR